MDTIHSNPDTDPCASHAYSNAHEYERGYHDGYRDGYANSRADTNTPPVNLMEVDLYVPSAGGCVRQGCVDDGVDASINDTWSHRGR